MSAPRGQWSSSIGFILAAAGSAIGLGNIWRFPYVTGENGGAAFVLIYLVCVFVIGLPYLLGELALGRHSQKNPIGAIEAIKGKSSWRLVGLLGIVTGFAILSYYAVIAGWTFGYIFKMLLNIDVSFVDYIKQPGLNIFLTLLFIMFTILVVIGGVQGGIERWSKILMPVLLVLMIVLIIRSITLDGAMKGLEFYLYPEFSKITGKVILEAMGQAFFSLSLGMGLMVTYGSYLPKRENLLKAGFWVAVFDTAIAIMAGLIIFPAIFAAGGKPDAGPALVFIALPTIFAQMPFGHIIGATFFLLLSIAALTSTISLLEVPVAYLVDEKKIARKIAVWLVGGVTFLVAIPSALSQGAVEGLSNLNIMGQQAFLDLMDFIWGNLSLSIGALVLSIFIGYIWKTKNAINEIAHGFELFTKPLIGPVSMASVWSFLVRFVVPVFIFIILLNIFNIF
ncbi:MAG: sodium-dependent transporter [Calditrichia bacterium]